MGTKLFTSPSSVYSDGNYFIHYIWRSPVIFGVIDWYQYRSSSSSSCSATSMDIPDPLSPLFPIVYRLWSSGLHSVSSHSCWMYVRAGCPAFARPYAEVNRSTSLMSSSLLLQQCPSCLVRLTWIVFVMRGRWPYSWCLVWCCRQDLFNIARSILVYLPSSFFSSRFVSDHVVHPYSSIDTTAAWKKLRFILSIRSDFHIIDSLLIAIHAFVSHESMSFSVDETLLPR